MSLHSDNGLDDKVLANIGEAYDMAIAYLQDDHEPISWSDHELKDMLASILLALADSGETDKLRLANLAIGRIRERSAGLRHKSLHSRLDQ